MAKPREFVACHACKPPCRDTTSNASRALRLFRAKLLEGCSRSLHSPALDRCAGMSSGLESSLDNAWILGSSPALLGLTSKVTSQLREVHRTLQLQVTKFGLT